MHIRMFWQVLLLPLGIWYYLYAKACSFKKITFIEIEIKGKIDDAPLTSGWMSLLKPPVNRFYLKILELIQLNDLLKLKKSRVRKQLKEILVIIKESNLGWGKAWEIKDMLETLKQRTKVRVYLESGDALSYFAALGADEIYIPPALDLYLIGPEINSLFYNRFLTKFGVKPNFLRLGRYKGASEKYTRNTFSAPNKQQFKELLKDFYLEFENSFLKNRSKKITSNLHMQNKKISLASFQKKAPYTSKGAFLSGLIDGVLYLDELKKILKKKHRADHAPFIPLTKAVSRGRFKQKKLINMGKKKKIAFIVGEGIILNSKEPNPRAISYEDYIKTMDQIKKQNYDAIIFRWNSPGGSAIVSDMLWAQILQLKNRDQEKNASKNDPWRMIPKSFENLKEKEGKKRFRFSRTKNKKEIPIYVSQSDVAASGGYFLSAISNHVYSSPTSITGSIGVIMGKFNIQLALKRLGIDYQSIETGSQSNILSPYSDFSLDQVKILKRNMKTMYDLFIDRIHRGRKMPTQKIKKLAEGRVYSGKRAYEMGLVDHLGGLKALFINLHKELKMTREDVMDIEFLPKIKDSLPQSFSQFSPLTNSQSYQWRIFKDLSSERVFFLDDYFL